MEILITSKTVFGENHVCVGGLDLANGRLLRLLNPGGYYQWKTAPLDIGDVWDMIYSSEQCQIVAPHVEDVIIRLNRKLRSVQITEEFLNELNVPIWRGGIDQLFDETLQWSGSGRGFLSEHVNPLPPQSVGFWISDQPLILHERDDKHVYTYTELFAPKHLVWKGTVDPVDTIPVGTVLRVSLAKWWRHPDSELEKRCYLQLSGWY